MDRPKRQKKIPKKFEDFLSLEPSKKRRKNQDQKNVNDHQRDSHKTRVNEASTTHHPDLSPPATPTRPQVTQTTQTEAKKSTKKTTSAGSQTSPLTPMEKLEKLYTDVDFPTAYSGNLQKFLRTKESLSRHKRRILKFKRRQIKVNGPYVLIQADTIFYRNYSRQNNGYKYILAVVDCFSRKNWCRPMRTTTADEAAKNIEDILQTMPYTPTQFASDQGNEFNSKHPSIFNTLIDRYGLLMFTLRGPHKASIVERFIRSLKSRIERYFTEHNTFKWIDVLPKISEALNNSYNRSIGMAPNEVNFSNKDKVFDTLYGAKEAPTLCKFQIGDRVRLPLEKDIFTKGYAANWSKEIYKITDKRFDGKLCYYLVRNLDGSKIPGKTFYYPEELNLVLRSEENEIH